MVFEASVLKTSAGFVQPLDCRISCQSTMPARPCPLPEWRKCTHRANLRWRVDIESSLLQELGIVPVEIVRPRSGRSGRRAPSPRAAAAGLRSASARSVPSSPNRRSKAPGGSAVHPARLRRRHHLRVGRPHRRGRGVANHQRHALVVSRVEVEAQVVVPAFRVGTCRHDRTRIAMRSATGRWRFARTDCAARSRRTCRIALEPCLASRGSMAR